MVDDDDDGDRNETELWHAPPTTTLQAIAEQYTADVARAAQRYAEGRVPSVRRAGCAVPKDYARELVDDAHADTWSGRLAWDPERCDLLTHLRIAIYNRTWAEIRRAARRPHFSIDAPANDRAWAIDPAEVEHALVHAAASGCSPVVQDALLTRACDELRRMVVDDRDAIDLLWCWEQSILERDKVMAIVGLDESRYQRARKRLLYLARNLPPELREAAQELLRSAS